MFAGTLLAGAAKQELFIERQIIVPSDYPTDTDFGRSVDISSDGNTLLVGAPFIDTARGAAYVFVRSGNTWTQQAKLVGSLRFNFDYFGYYSAISGDGNTVVIGVYGRSNNSGRAYIFTRSGTSWSEQALLSASDYSDFDSFGSAVDISFNGDRVVIGAPNALVNSRGQAYVFDRSGTTWSETKILNHPTLSTDYLYFGQSVSISDNGDTIAIGAYGANSSGDVSIFYDYGYDIIPFDSFTSSDIAFADDFGIRVSLSSDGNSLVVGAPREDTSPTQNNGAAYVFEYSSGWSQQAKLMPSDAESQQFQGNFGKAVKISPDGKKIIVGAPISNNSTGKAYFFAKSGATWKQSQIITGSNSANNDMFGDSVTISSSDIVVVGSTNANTSGSSYVYNLV